MKKNSIYLGENSTTEIDIIISKNTYLPAKLVLNNKSFPKIEFSDENTIKIIKENKKKLKDSLTFVYKSRRYTAIDNQFDYSIIHSSMIIESEVVNKKEYSFTSIRFYLTNLNNYMLYGNIETKIENDNIIRNINIPKFDVQINYHGESIRFFNKYICDTKKEDRAFVVDEYPCLIIESKNGFKIENIQSFCHDVCMIFSFITGSPCHPLYTWISKDNSYYQSCYFPVPNIKETEIEFHLEYILKFKDLCNKNYFETIIKNYYSKDKNLLFKKLFSRFYYLMISNNEWEYALLGYISIYEKYISKTSKKITRKNIIPVETIETVKAQLIGKIKTEINDVDFKIIKDIIDSFNDKITLEQKKERNFREKHLEWINSLDKTLISIFNFTEEEFKTIKKLRDNIAHSNVIEYQNYDFNDLFKIVNKLKLIILYIIYNNMGLENSYIIKNLSSTMNKLKRNSNIDFISLKRATGIVPFLLVSKEDFDYFADQNYHDVVIEISKENNQLHYNINRENTKKVNNKWEDLNQNKFSDIRAFLRYLYNNINIEIKYSPGYIETDEGDILEINGTSLIEIMK